jgi:hypothetical protein
VPVRVRIDHKPDDVPLVAGMTATVVVGTGRAPLPTWFMGLRDRVAGPTASPAGGQVEADRR